MRCSLAVDDGVDLMSTHDSRHPQDSENQDFTHYNTLLTDLTSMLITLPVGEVESEFNRGLSQVVVWLGIDQAVLLQFSEDHTAFQSCYQVNAENTVSPLWNVDTWQVDNWTLEKLRRNDPILYQQITELPSEALSEYGLTEKLGIKSCVIVPLYTERSLLGVIRLQVYEKQYQWPNDLLPRLTVIGRILTNLLIRSYTEETLQESNDQLVATLRAIPDMMLEVDQEGLIYDYRVPTHETFHLSLDTLVGQKVEAVLSLDAANVLGQVLNDAAQHGYHRGATYAMYTPMGLRWFELSAAIKGISESDNSHFIVFIRDITERTHAEEVLRERDRLQAALDTEKELHMIKDNLMRTISHEFRTPLAVIELSNSLLTNYYDQLTMPQRTRQLKAVHDQVKKLEDMVGEIISAVKGISNEVSFEPNYTDLEMLCQLTVSEVQSTLGARHHIAFHAEGYLQNIWLDQRLINRILINLLSNAIKYSPESSVITLLVREDESNVVIEIADQGIGISVEDQARLFEPFFRASNVGSIDGMGLGLIIVRDCVQLHQGTLTIKSEVNRGTTFVISLPKERRVVRASVS
jgi:PAS domain S-box-containing protein